MAAEGSQMKVNEDAHELITEENVLASLRSDKGAACTLNSFEIKDFTKKGDNYACFVTSVEVKYTLNGGQNEVTYIVKLNPNKNIQTVENFDSLLFEKEAKFYTVLAPEINRILLASNQASLRIPKCFHTTLELGQESIYLEDMRKKGFRMYDRMKGLDEPHTNLVLQELARLHAASHILAAENKTDNLISKYSFLREIYLYKEDQASAERMEPIFRSFIKTCASIADKVPGYECVAKYLEELVPNCMSLFEGEMVNSDSRFTAINHGDCWNNNLLFRYDDNGNPLEVCLVDLQINRCSSLGLDLNYLFYNSLTGDLRKQCRQSFFKLYYSSYESVIASVGRTMIFNVEELHSEFIKHNMFGLLMSLLMIPIFLIDSTEALSFDDLSEDNVNEKMKKNEEKILSLIDTSPVLRPRLLDTFDDFLATGLIPQDE